MNKRVVISGIGIVSPIGNNARDFLESIKSGKSGIKYIDELQDYNLVCRFGGIPEDFDESDKLILNKYEVINADTSIQYSLIAALEAWDNAGLKYLADENDVYKDRGAIVGTSFGGTEFFVRKILPIVSGGKIKRLGSQAIEHFMHSGSAAVLSRVFGLANQTTANSSACSTGLKAIIMAYEKVKSGKAILMLAGGTEPYSPYAWAGFDAMRVLCRGNYADASSASRPMSVSALGFVPSAGAGILIVEELNHAINRGATIYAEIVGAEINSGAQRNGGSMTFPNPKRVVDCIRSAIHQAGIKGNDINLISGHLTGTIADKTEIANWIDALELNGSFPYINAPKSLFGHMIGATGAVETIASILQLKYNFVHPSLNCEDINPEIERIWPREKIPQQSIYNINLQYVAKASFGFGDINSCLILRKFN